MSCSKSLKTEEEKEKRNLKWNLGHITIFLDTYVNYELLWNIRHIDYANKAKRESAIMKLMVDLTDQGTPVPDLAFLRARIKAIKSTYKTELLKVCESKKSGKGTDDLYVPKLPWFSTADSFMRDVSVTRKSASNLTIQERSTPSNDGVIDEGNVDDGNLFTELDQDVNVEHLEEAPPKETLTNIETPQPNKRRMTKLSKVENAIAKLQQITETTRSSSTSSTELDEVAVFGTHLAAQLRTLPTRNRLTLQDKIQSLITNERLKLIESPQPSPLLCSTSNSSYGMDSDEDYTHDGSSIYRNLH